MPRQDSASRCLPDAMMRYHAHQHFIVLPPFCRRCHAATSRNTDATTLSKEPSLPTAARAATLPSVITRVAAFTLIVYANMPTYMSPAPLRAKFGWRAWLALMLFTAPRDTPCSCHLAFHRLRHDHAITPCVYC